MSHSLVFIEVDKEDQQHVAERFPDATIIQESLEADELADRCKDATVLSTFIKTQFPRDVIEKLPNLQLLCTRSVGYNHIDLDACKANNVTVCNVPDYGSHVIAEHVFALLLSTLRHIPEADKRVEEGMFNYHGLRGVSLRGKTIGIIGTGKIGRKVAQIAHGFGMHIKAVDRCRVVELQDILHVEYVSLDDLLAGSDIITLHLPANENTHHMINADAFAKMKDDVILVNTARGELIDSNALLDALNNDKVGHALLDVMEHEHNFEENKELIHHDKVVSTPHIAFYAEESMHNMFEDCFESINQFLSGNEPDHVVHPPTVVCDMSGITQK